MREASYTRHKVAVPPVHGGIVRALDACYGRLPAMPEDFQRLLDQLS